MKRPSASAATAGLIWSPVLMVLARNSDPHLNGVTILISDMCCGVRPLLRWLSVEWSWGRVRGCAAAVLDRGDKSGGLECTPPAAGVDLNQGGRGRDTA